MSYVTDTPSLIFSRDDGSWLRVRCEIANTPALRSRGLMQRATLPPSTGMLFVWPEPEPISMWMENTPLALDIVFIGPNGRVVGISHGKPMDATSIPAPQPVQLVLELPFGWCARHGVRVGASATPVAVPPALA